MVSGVSHLQVFSSKKFEVYLMYPEFKFEFKHPNVQKCNIYICKHTEEIDETMVMAILQGLIPFKNLSGSFLHLDARVRDLTKNHSFGPSCTH
jgi:hypothetical protein